MAEVIHCSQQEIPLLHKRSDKTSERLWTHFFILIANSEAKPYCSKKHKGNNAHKHMQPGRKFAHTQPLTTSTVGNHDMGPLVQTCATRMCNHCAMLHLCTTLYCGGQCTQVVSTVDESPLELSESTESGWDDCSWTHPMLLHPTRDDTTMTNMPAEMASKELIHTGKAFSSWRLYMSVSTVRALVEYSADLQILNSGTQLLKYCVSTGPEIVVICANGPHVYTT